MAFREKLKVNGGNSGHMGNSRQRQFLQRIGRRRRPRQRESFPTASCSVPYRHRCQWRPICCKNCRCPELPTCLDFPPFTLSVIILAIHKNTEWYLTRETDTERKPSVCCSILVRVVVGGKSHMTEELLN